jgi:hypothetical protein
MLFYSFFIKSMIIVIGIVAVAYIFGRIFIYNNLPKDDDE